MEICIDFDGTCVTHDYPNIGKDIGAAPILRRLVKRGHRLILFTMRSNPDNIQSAGRMHLTEAISWFGINDIPLYGINSNPSQITWTNSPKAYAQLYIDDAALGCPLVNSELSTRPYADWTVIEKMLTEKGIL